MAAKFTSEFAAVIKHAQRQTVRVFGRFGGYMRKVVRTSLRKRKTSSPPGKPPAGHGNQLLKNFTFYAVEPQSPSVIIGPAKVAGTLSSSAPSALERGGKTRIRTVVRGKPVEKTVILKPRPYIGPAAAKTLAALPAMWTNI